MSDFLLNKINDYYTHLIFNEIGKNFTDLSDIEQELSKAFSLWKTNFPEKIVPEFISNNSLFEELDKK